jgi:hypothetical protein
MYYMLAFNPVENLLTFWDEPTITMDYASHPLHSTLARNWRENLVPNMILSSATLPPMEALEPMLLSHQTRFPDAEFITVQSFDSKKSIPVVNPAGFVEMPHFLAESQEEVLEMAEHCAANPTLLRDIGVAYLAVGKCDTAPPPSPLSPEVYVALAWFPLKSPPHPAVVIACAVQG